MVIYMRIARKKSKQKQNFEFDMSFILKNISNNIS